MKYLLIILCLLMSGCATKYKAIPHYKSVTDDNPNDWYEPIRTLDYYILEPYKESER